MYTIHLGVSGFPQLNNATIQRMRLTFKSLNNTSLTPLIINKASLAKTGSKQHAGRYNGILYVNTASDPSRPDSFIKRNLNKLSGIIFEFCFLYKKRKSINSAIFYSASFWELLYYSLLSRLFSFKLTIQYVEYRSSIPSRKKLLLRLNDYLFDNYCFFYIDGIIVISEFLKERSLAKNKKLPFIKVSAVTDFNDFLIEPTKDHTDYLMYCGTIDYLPVIDLVMDLFERLKDNKVYTGNLMLVIGGNNAANFDTLDNRIKTSKFSSNIILKRNVAHKTIPALYLGADLLLIPLRKTLQDIARFPQKISEYTASKKAILSTNVGDVGHYFKSGDSAILADEYSVDSYYDTVSKYLRSKEEMLRIGENGYQVGMKNFNYLAYSVPLESFLLKL